MEAVPEAPAPVTQSSIFTLARFTLILIPVLSFLGYYGPYVVGLSYHQKLLSQFDVPPGLFESDTRDIFISAYMATLEVGSSWIQITLNSYLLPIGCFFIGVAFIAWIALTSRKDKNSKVDQFIRRKVESKWVLLPSAFLIFGIAVASLSITLPVALYALLAMPATIGQEGAQLVFERRQKVFAGGCGVENEQHIYCASVVDNGKVIAVGFTIATSGTRIALYQPKRTKVLKLGDETIEVMPPEEYRRYEASLKAP